MSDGFKVICIQLVENILTVRIILIHVRIGDNIELIIQISNAAENSVLRCLDQLVIEPIFMFLKDKIMILQ